MFLIFTNKNTWQWNYVWNLIWLLDEMLTEYGFKYDCLSDYTLHLLKTAHPLTQMSVNFTSSISFCMTQDNQITVVQRIVLRNPSFD